MAWMPAAPNLTFRRRLRGAGSARLAGLLAASGAAVALLAGSGTAAAADNGFYLGAGLTQSRINDIGPSIDFKDNSYKLIAGFRPLDHFAVEVNYIDLGKDSESLGPVSATVDGKAYAAFAVGYLPLPLVDLYAKRPQVQERLTTQVADALVRILEPRGAVVVIEAEHLCMTMRGVRKAGARTVTSAVRGMMHNQATRAEVMALINASK